MLAKGTLGIVSLAELPLLGKNLLGETSGGNKTSPTRSMFSRSLRQHPAMCVRRAFASSARERIALISRRLRV